MKKRLVNNKDQNSFWQNRKNQRDYKHEIVKFFSLQRINHINDVIDLDDLESGLDVGCGDGFATYYYQEYIAKMYGGDISKEMIKNNPLPKENLSIINAECMDGISDKSYDLVNCWEVLHHLEKPHRAIEEMRRISKKYIVVFEPNRNNLLQTIFGLVVKEERGTLRSSKRYLEKLFLDNNIKIIHSLYCGRIFPNKLPIFVFPFIKMLPFKANKLTGTSILLVGEL